MEKIYKGGYAEVFYDPDKKEIFRILPKHNPKTKELDISTIADLIFTRSLDYTDHTPIIHSEMITNDEVTYRMPHYGLPLHKWIRKTPLEERKRQAAYILYQVVAGCIYFEINGFMHTDLKPSNIMVSEEDGDLRVRIIDFNCVSVREVHTEDPTLEWTTAVGTWSYCPPEIILYETPFQTTPSWSIGLLAACILDRYPFPDSITSGVTDQEGWSYLLDQWYVTYPEHPPLPGRECYGESWDELIYGCISWRVRTRWTLPHIHDYIYQYLLKDTERTRPRILPNPEVCPICYIIDVGGVNPDLRKRAVSTLYSLCEKMELMNLFPTAMAIVDRCLPLLDAEMLQVIEMIGVGSYLLTCAIYNLAVFSSRSHMSKILNHVGSIHRSILTIYMFHVAKLLSWRLWEKPVHIWVVDIDLFQIHNEKLFPYIRDAFLSQKGSYTQKELAMEVLARIRAE